MEPRYRIDNAAEIISPALIVYSEIVAENIAKMVRIAGGPTRLRPHCKTHKMREVAELQVRLGVTKHKCATFPEAEMLASAGAEDVLLAYHLVGPNLGRAVDFVRKYPRVAFSVIADHGGPIAQLGRAMAAAGAAADVLLDLDTGQHRTGVGIGPAAKELYRSLAETEGLRPGGLHVYDGQNHQTPFDERKAAVDAVWAEVADFRDRLLEEGWPVPKVVAGGTGSFPAYAAHQDPTLELSPGTCVFHDAGYQRLFPDLDFTPAALVLTRVISRPTTGRVTLDLGYKACASDPPAGQRLVFPDLPDAREVLQNEEHLVIETSQAARLQPGDELLAIPWHACPTSALHRHAFVVSRGRWTTNWEVVARDRRLTV
jgi:D-serine deaminase-like pyridoxal phosphate-dependent protein